MKSIKIKGSLRAVVGKKDAKILRREEKVPCVLYGTSEPVHFSTLEKDLELLINTPNVYTVKLDIDGKSCDAIIQDTQYHPVSDKPLHFDFLQIAEDRKVVIDIPITLEGFAPGVQAGGKLQLAQRRLKVKGFLKDLPDTLKIDINELTLGKTIKIEDLNFDNLELLAAKNAVVCAVKLTRAARAAAESGEAEA